MVVFLFVNPPAGAGSNVLVQVTNLNLPGETHAMRLYNNLY